MTASISELEAENKGIEAQIPEQWQTARQQFLDLAKQDKIARNKYRRTVDDSYQVIKDTIAMVSSADALIRLKPDIEGLHQVIREQEIEPAIEQIKQLESELSTIKNAHPIKSKLSKARRELKKSQDRDKAVGQIVKAIEFVQSEIDWRVRAEQEFLPTLTQFNQVVKDNIGLRMQTRLNVDQAETIASCLAHHKDLSLSF